MFGLKLKKRHEYGNFHPQLKLWVTVVRHNLKLVKVMQFYLT